MGQFARDLLAPHRDFPSSPELRRLALNLIAPGVASLLGGI